MKDMDEGNQPTKQHQPQDDNSERNGPSNNLLPAHVDVVYKKERNKDGICL